MPQLRFLAIVVLSLIPGAYAAPPAAVPQPPGQPSINTPVRPCLVNSAGCLSIAPQPFRPCMAIPQSCGDHFSYMPVTAVPVIMPAGWSKTR
jgi:hypothetical protein